MCAYGATSATKPRKAEGQEGSLLAPGAASDAKSNAHRLLGSTDCTGIERRAFDFALYKATTELATAFSVTETASYGFFYSISQCTTAVSCIGFRSSAHMRRLVQTQRAQNPTEKKTKRCPSPKRTETRRTSPSSRSSAPREIKENKLRAAAQTVLRKRRIAFDFAAPALAHPVRPLDKFHRKHVAQEDRYSSVPKPNPRNQIREIKSEPKSNP
eukprot:1072938-Rhodomonas_salina.1